MRNFRRKNKVYKFFLFGLLLLFFGNILIYHQTKQINDEAAWVRHTNLVIQNTIEIRENFFNSLRLEQYYLHLNQQDVLDHLNSLLQDIQTKTMFLKKLTADNSEQQKNLAILESEINAHIKSFGDIAKLSKNNPSSGTSLFFSDQNTRLIDNIDAITTTIKNIELSLLEKRTKAVLSSRYLNFISVIIFSGLTDLLMIVLLFYINMKDKAHAMQQQKLIIQLLDNTKKAIDTTHHKSELLANMSHELRTPLNGIIGFSEVMISGKTGELSAVHIEYLQDILHSANYLLNLINDLLDFSKLEAGKMIFYPEPINVTNLVNEIINTLSQLTKNRNIGIETIIDPSLKPIVMDPMKLKQVFYNYLSNAIKFTDDYGRITVRIRPADENNFRLEVEDTGVGISDTDILKLFNEFQQLDNTARKSYAGTGIGLALTRRIVEAQGGKVGVSSILNQGSIFYAILPYQPRTPPPL